MSTDGSQAHTQAAQATQAYAAKRTTDDMPKVDTLQVTDGKQLFEAVHTAIRQLNTLAVHLFKHCSCKDMRAATSEFLCAVHPAPQSCSANSYAMHTMEAAALLLTDRQQFPKQQANSREQIQLLAVMMRRCYRIYAHAYFHHPSLYDHVASQATRFTATALEYGLMRKADFIIKDMSTEADSDAQEASGIIPILSPFATVSPHLLE